MKFPEYLILALAAACAAPSGLQAHISYNNRNFGTNPASVTIGNQAASSAFGWADAADADWGDSHRGRFFRFTLTTPASIMISVTRGGTATQTGIAGTFLPAFSLFSGLAQMSPETPAHDGADLSENSRPAGTEGSFRALTDWSIGNDPTYVTSGDPTSGILIGARLAPFTYLGHAADGTSVNFGLAPGINGDGNADGYITTIFHGLAAGDYSLFIGGANYAAQTTETPTYPTYGVNVTVQAVPEPSTWALLACGVGMAGLFLRWRMPR
jgi:hypothetical protein